VVCNVSTNLRLACSLVNKSQFLAVGAAFLGIHPKGLGELVLIYEIVTEHDAHY